MDAGWLWLVLRLVYVILGGCSRFRDLVVFGCFGLVLVASMVWWL